MHSISHTDRKVLLAVARRAIEEGVERQQRPVLELEQYSEVLRRPAASFVTLYLEGKLAGCIGSLEATRPLVEDVAENAYSAAFSDYRFAGIGKNDLQQLSLEIALLSPLQRVEVVSEAELQRQLTVNKHGLLIEMSVHRATFLPKVWKTLPDKKDFLEQLKLKAGLSRDFWSDKIECYLYTAESFSDV